MFAVLCWFFSWQAFVCQQFIVRLSSQEMRSCIPLFDDQTAYKPTQGV